MSLHINRFIDSLKAHESRGSRDFIMSLRDAKDLHADITKLLLSLETLRNSSKSTENDIIKISVDGGKF